MGLPACGPGATDLTYDSSSPQPDSGTQPDAAQPQDSAANPDGGAAIPDGRPAEPGKPDGGRLLVGYYQSWSDSWQSSGANTALAKLPAYVNVVNLAFMKPDATYQKGSLSLVGTGLDFPYDGPTLRDAIAALHQKNPGTRVLVSVGGATYWNWDGYVPTAIADFVADFGLDGVDLDYEPTAAACTSNGTTVTCPSDAQFASVVRSTRAQLSAGRWLSIAAWSVGAYGEGEWANALPESGFRGIALAVLKDATTSAAIDLVNVMSYDAGADYSPTEALRAYQHYFRGRIALGVEVPPEAWGGHVATLEEIDSLASAVVGSGAAGMMLWSIQKQGPAQPFATRLCQNLGLGGCSEPML
ncbi:MAG: glycosyl hydrolase family 18 protein [Myxococcales bacterium]